MTERYINLFSDLDLILMVEVKGIEIGKGTEHFVAPVQSYNRIVIPAYLAKLMKLKQGMALDIYIRIRRNKKV